MSGFFGIGADIEGINKLRAERSPSCEQLRSWGLPQASGQYY
jgi:DnaJ family protein B protein 12